MGFRSGTSRGLVCYRSQEALCCAPQEALCCGLQRWDLKRGSVRLMPQEALCCGPSRTPVCPPACPTFYPHTPARPHTCSAPPPARRPCKTRSRRVGYRICRLTPSCASCKPWCPSSRQGRQRPQLQRLLAPRAAAAAGAGARAARRGLLKCRKHRQPCPHSGGACWRPHSGVRLCVLGGRAHARTCSVCMCMDVYACVQECVHVFRF